VHSPDTESRCSARQAIFVAITVQQGAQSIAFTSSGFEIEAQVVDQMSQLGQSVLEQVEDVQSSAMALDNVA
jgi:L-asparaginase II